MQIPENAYHWKPQRHTVFKDPELAERIHQEGYAVLPLLDEQTLNELRNLYASEHNLDVENGGMFYTMYSSDLDYRMRVHEKIQTLLTPILEQHFQKYKNVVNSFVVKMSGEESEFYVHQDTSAIDEFQFSPLSLWIPLHDITDKNGALTIIEKTHWFFSPYRGVSFAFPFKNILNTVRKYLKPVYMKAGEVLVFDPRIIHNSQKNTSGEDRVAVICGVFDQNVQLETCFKDPSNEWNPIEVYAHDDDYVLRYPNFFYDCHVRPTSGTKVREVEDLFPQMSADEFVELCTLNGIREMNLLGDESGIPCQMIAEPDGVNKSELACTVEMAETVPEKRGGLFSWLKR